MLMILEHAAACANAAPIIVTEHFRVAVRLGIAAGAFVDGIAVFGAGRRNDCIDIAVRVIGEVFCCRIERIIFARYRHFAPLIIFSEKRNALERGTSVKRRFTDSRHARRYSDAFKRCAAGKRIFRYNGDLAGYLNRLDRRAAGENALAERLYAVRNAYRRKG